jgi:hypothetical protein
VQRMGDLVPPKSIICDAMYCPFHWVALITRR